MQSVDCRGGYLINTCFNSGLNDSAVSDGVNNVQARQNRIDVAGCDIVFGVSQNIFPPPACFVRRFSSSVTFRLCMLDELAFSCSQLEKIENHYIRSFDACEQSNVDSGREGGRVD